MQSEVAKRISRGDTFLEPEPIRVGLENYIADNSNGSYDNFPIPSLHRQTIFADDVEVGFGRRVSQVINAT